MSVLSQGISRRSFLAGALATGAALAMAGSAVTANTKVTKADESSDEPVYGGTFRYYITNPVAIEPFGAEENQGVEVMFNTYDPLCVYDFDKGAVVGLTAESWEVNEAADEFTFHIRPEAKFHNGQPVTSADFKYSWERLVNAYFQPQPSSLGYKLSQVGGADEMMNGTGTELDVECPDDQTFIVHLKAPFADFASIVCERATAPVPAGCTDTTEDYQNFQKHPIGNGCFMVDDDGWVDGQYIRLVPFDDYWGDKPYVDDIIFHIMTSDDTAWTEFQAGNLDFLIIPSGHFNEAKQLYGESPDGYTCNPGEQAIFGDETSIYYLICNNLDETMSNRELRIAISYAVDRQAICDTVLQGTRSPATNMLAASIPGAVEGSWQYAQPTKDVEAANEWFEKAGYPADENGKRDLKLTFSTNTGSSNEDIMQMVMADLEAVGVSCELNLQEWAAYIDSLQDSDYQIGRLGWTIQVPYADAVLQPIFYTGSGDNNSNYTNPEFDAAIDAARQIVDDDERAAAYQAANLIVAEDFPVIPMFYYKHTYVSSDRVHNLYFTPSAYATLNHCWLS